MGKLNDTFGIYAAHLGNVIADTAKQCDRATLQGSKCSPSQCIPVRPFITCKTLRLAKQKENTDIITIVNLVQITHEKYIELKKIYSSHPEKSFEQMPTLKDVLSNVDNQNRCQGATLKNFECDKEYLERNVSCLIQDVIKCFEQRYDDLMDKVHEDATNKSKKLLKVTGCYHTLAKSSTAKFGQTK